MDLYAREGYMEDDVFDWTTVHASKSGKSPPGAAAKLANVSGAKHGPPAANPNVKMKVKMTLEGGVAELVQRVDLVMKPHEATQAKNEATGQLGPVKSGFAAREKVVSKAKPLPEKPTTNELEFKTRPKVLNKIAIATKPTLGLANSKAKLPVVKPGPVKSPPRLVPKAVLMAKPPQKTNHRKIERIPVCQSPTPSTPSPRLDMDKVLEKLEDLKLSDKRPSTQRNTKESDPTHLYSGNRKVQAQKYTPQPPHVRPSAAKQLEQKKAAPKLQPTRHVPAVKKPLSSEGFETSSDLDDTKSTKPGAVPTRRIPLRVRNVAFIHSSPQRRKNPPRLVNVNMNAKSPPRRRVMVTRAAAGRKGE